MKKDTVNQACTMLAAALMTSFAGSIYTGIGAQAMNIMTGVAGII